MSAIGRTLITFLVVITLGVLTVAPSFGVLDLSINYFAQYPFVVILGDLIWAMLIITILPISMNYYKIISTSIFVVFFCILLYLLMVYVPLVFNFVPLLVWGGIVLFSSIAWLLVSPPIWRAVHGIIPVHNSNTSDHHN